MSGRGEGGVGEGEVTLALLAVSHVGSTALLVVVLATFTIGRMAPSPSLHGREREERSEEEWGGGRKVER